MASPFAITTARNAADIVTIDLTRHPPNVPLGMLLAPGAGSSSPSSPTSSGETTLLGNNNYFSSSAAHYSPVGPTPLSPSSNSNTSPTASNVTLVAGWERNDNNGRHLGPIQRSGLVRLGDRLVRINGKDVTEWTFREVMDALKELVNAAATTNNNNSSYSSTRRRGLKTLGFAPAGTSEWSRGTHQPTAISDSIFFGLFNNNILSQQHQSASSMTTAHVVHSKRRYSFVSFIGQWRVACGHNDGSSSSAAAEECLLENNDGHQEEQQQRQHSENTNELERQLNKEPSIKYDELSNNMNGAQQQQKPQLPPQLSPQIKEAGTALPTNNSQTTTNPDENKPFIQYEIQCHILFRDPSSFQSHSDPSGNINPLTNNSNNPNNILHHSWSVWKRYSEFATLHETLRHDFGWQMDNNEGNGEGIVFPSAHGVESWWYGVRNGGGVVTSLLGGSSGIPGEDSVVEKGGNGNDAAVDNNNGYDNVIVEDSSSGWGSSLYGLFRSTSNQEQDTTNRKGAPTTKQSPGDNGNDDTNNSHANCPFPNSFIEKRQKELAIYWSNLMKIEDIFEFSDVHSHKFGKAMASFLEADKVLLARRRNSPSSSLANGQHNHHQQHSSKDAFPAINENESTEMLSSFRPTFTSPTLSATREVVSGMIHDDDVSILSDGTGAFGDSAVHHSMNINRSSHGGGRPVVDIVPGRYTNNSSDITNGGSDGKNHVAMGSSSAQERQKVRSSSSVPSSSVASRSRQRRGNRAAPRAKPAFQRQFLQP